MDWTTEIALGSFRLFLCGCHAKKKCIRLLKFSSSHSFWDTSVESVANIQRTGDEECVIPDCGASSASVHSLLKRNMMQRNGQICPELCVQQCTAHFTRLDCGQETQSGPQWNHGKITSCHHYILATSLYRTQINGGAAAASHLSTPALQREQIFAEVKSRNASMQDDTQKNCSVFCLIQQ